MKTLYFGGPILTMAQPLYVPALLTEGDTILAAGTKEELSAMAPDAALVDLQGRTLMPAFIDPHSHFAQVAFSLLRAPLDGAASPEEMGSRIRAFIKERNIQPGQWVIARDYDNNRLPGAKNPTLAQLDAMCPENPLMIHHKSGHMGLVNSRGLDALGLTPESPVPAGGHMEVVDGRLTGYMEENAFFTAMQGVPPVDMADLEQALVKAQEKYASYGITTVQEGLIVGQMLPIYQLLSAKKLLKLDVVLYASPDSYEQAEQLLQTPGFDKHIHLGGVKVLLDGSPQGRTAWMRQPYAGSDDYCAYGTMTDEALTDAFVFAGQHNTQLLGHCNGDGAAEQYLRCLAKAEETVPQLKNLRPVIIHGQLMGRDQIPRAKELGAMISFFVAHVYHWGDVHIKNFGMERASHISAAKTALTCGVPFTFHQDAPVIEPDMLETIWCAVNRQTRDGVDLGRADEGVSTLDALHALTSTAAWQYSAEDSLGTLEAGKKADLVVLSENPLDTPDDCLRDIQVLATFKNGACIYHK